MTAAKKREIDRHHVSLPRGHETPKLRLPRQRPLLSSTPPVAHVARTRGSAARAKYALLPKAHGAAVCLITI